MKTKASNLLNNIKNKSENNNNNFFNKTFISNQKLNLSEIKIPSKLTNEKLIFFQNHVKIFYY